MVTPLTVHARTPATLQPLAPQWLNLTHSSHFVHQTVTIGDEACHSSSSPSPPSSSSRFPSSAGDGGATPAMAAAVRVPAEAAAAPPPLPPHLYSFIPSWPSSTWRPYPPRRLAIRWPPCCFFKKNKVAAPLDLHDGCSSWWALLVGSPKPKLHV